MDSSRLSPTGALNERAPRCRSALTIRTASRAQISTKRLHPGFAEGRSNHGRLFRYVGAVEPQVIHHRFCRAISRPRPPGHKPSTQPGSTPADPAGQAANTLNRQRQIIMVPTSKPSLQKQRLQITFPTLKNRPADTAVPCCTADRTPDKIPILTLDRGLQPRFIG